ncbi:MAG: hypothetical protein M1281_00925 [Chloroflexi bacterium]|nr:hypothetical protein [Chloroflexota bacterium]
MNTTLPKLAKMTVNYLAVYLERPERDRGRVDGLDLGFSLRNPAALGTSILQGTGAWEQAAQSRRRQSQGEALPDHLSEQL